MNYVRTNNNLLVFTPYGIHQFSGTTDSLNDEMDELEYDIVLGKDNSFFVQKNNFYFDVINGKIDAAYFKGERLKPEHVSILNHNRELLKYIKDAD